MSLLFCSKVGCTSGSTLGPNEHALGSNFELITSDGITLDQLVYCGKGMFYDNEHSDMPTTERIPVALIEPFLNKGHILFTDNYYTSPSLAQHLLEN